MENDIRLSLDQARNFAIRVLMSTGFSEELAQSVAEAVVAGERDGCKSHGLYRLLVCAHTLKSGKVNPQAIPKITQSSPGILRIDADQGYSLLALEKGLDPFCEMVSRQGFAAMVINRCVHFSALWYDIERLTARGYVAFAMTPSHAWVAPAGGKSPLLGTNPLAFGWPRLNSDPYVFDFATSAAARGDIELHRREGKSLQPGWGIDEAGNPSTDQEEALKGAMMTFGGHKGSALSTMVELLAGALINDFTSQESMDFDAKTGSSPMGGELIIAFDPVKFMGSSLESGHKKAERLFKGITYQGARLPSERRFANRKLAITHGITINKQLYDDILALEI